MPARFLGSSRAAAGYCTTNRSACRLLSLGRARNEYASEGAPLPAQSPTSSSTRLRRRAERVRAEWSRARAGAPRTTDRTSATFAKRRCLKHFMAGTSMNHRPPQAGVRALAPPPGLSSGPPHGPPCSPRSPPRLRARTPSNVTNVGRDDASGCEMRSGRGRKEQFCSARSRLEFALARLPRPFAMRPCNCVFARGARGERLLPSTMREGGGAAEMDQCERRMPSGRLARSARTDTRLARLARLAWVVALATSCSARQVHRVRGGCAYRSVRVRRNVAHVAHVASPVAIRQLIGMGSTVLRAARRLHHRREARTSEAQRTGASRKRDQRDERDELDMPFPSPPGSCSILHPEDYAASINFNKWLDLVRFCDLSRTSPTGFRTQTRLTEFGLTCHPRRVRAHRRVVLASIGFVRITCPRSPPRHDQLTPRACGRTRMASLEDTLARSQEAHVGAPLDKQRSAWAERRADPAKTLTEDVRWLLRGSISKKADGGCTSSSSGRSSRSA